jgi:hypothetical protein
MRRGALVGLLMAGSVAACNNDEVLIVDDGPPAAPRALAASYYGGAVTVEWELAAGWDGETFRVYSRRVTDADYFLIADVTSCADGLCSYVDWNVVADETYEYYVSAVGVGSGLETATASSVQVYVPTPIPPPVPDAPQVIALDGALYFIWGSAARGAGDFSHYRVYQDAGGTSYLLGETDSEGFLDLLAANGSTYEYFVTSLDTDGHESAGSPSASGTPRPDFTGEWIYDHFDDPTASGFRFADDESTYPIVSGTDTSRDFRVERDGGGVWWLVPNAAASVSVYPSGFVTTALKCGVAADAGCVDVSVAPSSGYTMADVELLPQTSYVIRIGSGASAYYGVIRVVYQGFDQNGDALMIFDWAYQLQAGNRNLVSQPGT